VVCLGLELGEAKAITSILNFESFATFRGDDEPPKCKDQCAMRNGNAHGSALC